MKHSHVIVATIGLLLVTTGCTTAGVSTPPSEAPAPVSQPPVTPEPEPALTGAMIAEWVANEVWSFASEGFQEPFTVTLEDGTASTESMVTYELGDFVEADANGDGVIDIAIPITQFDGNGVQQLWYVWLGIPDAVDGDEVEGAALAEQLVYPIARMSRCGDTVHNVTALDAGFAVEESLRHPLDPGDCADTGTWHQTREITITEFDGGHFPVLTAPIDAWGGVCPVPTVEWLDGEPMSGVEVRVAPAPSSTVIVNPDETFGVFGLPEAPLMTASGSSFFGFMPTEYLEHSNEQIAATPVRTHCAFADAPSTE